MESITYLKNLKISPKKLRFLLPQIKKLKPSEILDYLFYTPKKAAKIWYQAIKSAINNAKNTLKVSDDLLKFKLLTVEEGRKLKRYRPGGRGTVKPYIKRYSHIKIILKAEEKDVKKSSESSLRNILPIEKKKEILKSKQKSKKETGKVLSYKQKK